jgi:subtilisin family serine protease
MRKILCLFYLLMIVSLAACGGDRTTGISSGSRDEGGSITVGAVPQAILAQAAKGDYKEGEILVKFKSGVVSASSQQVHKAAGSSLIKKYEMVSNLELVKLPKGMSVQEAIQSYMADPNVEYAEPNYRRCLARIPNDTYFRNQWSLHNDGTYASGTPDADLDAPEAWEISAGNRSIIVAVLDSGIDFNHQDLVGNIWKNLGEANCFDYIDNDGNGYIDDCNGWDFANDNNSPMDDEGHGTHVAGVIGARGHNNLGIAGLMWDVQLMPVKVFNPDTELTGSCGSLYASDVVAGIYYAANNGAKVINASINGEGYCISEYEAINYANSLGVLFVAAAGNGGYDGIGDNNDITPHYPSNYNLPNIISVAATDQDDRRVPFSNYGPNTVHVAAPGVYTFSTVPSWWSNYTGYGYLEFFAGTSMAAPHVAGLAGLLSSYYDGVNNTYFTVPQIKATILRYVDVLPTLDGWISTRGRINAHRALSSLLAPTSLRAKASSSKVSLSWQDNATGEDGYIVERGASGSAYTAIAQLAAGATSFEDTAITGGASYVYRVKAFNNIAESFSSNDVSVTVPRKSGGGGGGCSIAGDQNTIAALADLTVLLIPFIFAAVMRRRK